MTDALKPFAPDLEYIFTAYSFQRPRKESFILFFAQGEKTCCRTPYRTITPSHFIQRCELCFNAWKSLTSAFRNNYFLYEFISKWERSKRFWAKFTLFPILLETDSFYLLQVYELCIRQFCLQGRSTGVENNFDCSTVYRILKFIFNAENPTNCPCHPRQVLRLLLKYICFHEASLVLQ